MDFRIVRSAFLILATAACVGRGARAQVIIQVDHHTGAVSVTDSSGTHIAEVIDGKTLRFHRPASVRLQVVNGNTALYDYSISTEATKTDTPSGNSQLQPVGLFLSSVKVYLPELSLAVRAGKRGPAGSGSSILPSDAPTLATPAATEAANTALQNGKAVETDLKLLDSLTRGSKGVSGALRLTMRALDRMHRGEVEGAARELADSLILPTQACGEPGGASRTRGSRAGALRLSTQVLARIDSLKADNDALAASVSDARLTQDTAAHGFVMLLADLSTRADSALKNNDPLVASAYRIEQMATTVATGCSRWESPQPLTVAKGAGQVVTIKIQPRSDPEIQRVATDVPAPISVTLLPPPDRLVAKLGASALYAPRARYPTYGVRSAGGAGAQPLIYEDKPVDDRFSYGLTLGATLPAWFNRGNFALWLPEITIADPGTNSRALGLGAALSYRSIKLGAGGSWFKHTVLDTLGVGKSLPNAQFLKQHDSYGRPVTYFSISVFNLSELLGMAGGSGDAAPAPAPSKGSQPRPSKP